MSYFGIYKGRNIPKISNTFGTDDTILINPVKGNEAFNMEVPLFSDNEGIENKIGLVKAIYSKNVNIEKFELGLINIITNIVKSESGIVSLLELTYADGTVIDYYQVDNSNVLKSNEIDNYFEVEYNYSNDVITGPKNFKLYDQLGNYFIYPYDTIKNIDIIPSSYHQVKGNRIINIEQEKAYLILSCDNQRIEFELYTESEFFGYFYVDNKLISLVEIFLDDNMMLSEVKKYIVYRDEDENEQRSLVVNKIYEINGNYILVKNGITNKYTKYYLENDIVTRFVNCFESNELSGKSTSITYYNNKTYVTDYKNKETKYFFNNNRTEAIVLPGGKVKTNKYDDGRLIESLNVLDLTNNGFILRENLFNNSEQFTNLINNLSESERNNVTIDETNPNKLIVSNTSIDNDYEISFTINNLSIRKDSGITFLLNVNRDLNNNDSKLEASLALYNSNRPDPLFHQYKISIEEQGAFNDDIPISRMFTAIETHDTAIITLKIPKGNTRYEISNIQLYNNLYGTINKYNEYGFVTKSYNGENIRKRSYIKEDKALLLTSKETNKNASIYNYDDNGNVIEVINSNGTRNLYEYDTNNNLIKETLINDFDDYIEKTYTYSEDGECILSETSANGYVTNYLYKNNNRLLDKITYNNGLSEEFSYNDYFNIDTHKVNKSLGENIQTAYHYDNYRRLDEITLDNNYSYKFDYDSFGNITNTKIKKISNETVLDTCTYEVNNDVYTENLKSHQIGSAPSQNNKHIYTYDDNNNIEYVYVNSISEDNKLYQFTYDVNNNLIQINDFKNIEVINFTYDKYGNLIEEEKTSNGLVVKTNYKYDSKGNLLCSENKINNNTIDLYGYSKGKQEINSPLNLYNYYNTIDKDIYSCLLLNNKEERNFINAYGKLRMGEDVKYVNVNNLQNNNNKKFNLMLQEHPELYYYIDDTSAGNRSFAFWFKNDDDNRGKYLFSVSNVIKNYLHDSYQNSICFKINNENKIEIESYNYVVPVVLDNNWNFIAITLIKNDTDTTCKIYLNGYVFSVNVYPQLNNTQTQEFCYGNDVTTKLECNRFIGSIACMFTCTKALSIDEINEIYSDTKKYYINYNAPETNDAYDTDLITKRYIHNKNCIVIPLSESFESVNSNINFYFDEAYGYNREKDSIFVYDKANYKDNVYKVSCNDLKYKNEFTGSFSMSFNSYLNDPTRDCFLLELTNEDITSNVAILRLIAQDGDLIAYLNDIELDTNINITPNVINKYFVSLYLSDRDGVTGEYIYALKIKVNNDATSYTYYYRTYNEVHFNNIVLDKKNDGHYDFNSLINMIYIANQSSSLNVMNDLYKVEKYIKTINNIGNLYKEEIYNSGSRILTKDIAYKKEVANGKTKCYNIIETEVFYTDNLVIPDRMIGYETDSYTGNVTRRTLENPEDILDESQYLYDKTGQLTEEKKPYEQTRLSYLYDNSGNVLKVEKFDINSSLSLSKTEFTYDTVVPNRLLSIIKDGVTKTFTYSSALPGMPISINNGIYTQTLEWSGSKLTKYDYENGKSLSFTYDSSGLRIKKVLTNNLYLGTITHNYRYSGNRLIEEYVIDDIKGDEYKLHYLYDESGKLYGFEYGTNTYYYLRDTLLNIIGIINTSGQIVCEYKYDAYGNHKVLNSNRVETTSGNFIGNINPFRYKGYYYDVETNLFLVSSRYYSPELCRWISPDDIEYLDPESVNGLNLYCYCFNNPIMYIDPDGHMPKWLENTLKIGGAVLLTAALVAGSIFIAGPASIILAGAALGSAGGLIGGGISSGISSVMSGGSFIDGFADGALSGSITGAISGAVAASPLGLLGQVGVNALISGANYSINYYNDFNICDFVFNFVLGGLAGLVGGDGWTKAGSTLAYDLAFNGIKGSFMMLGRGALNEFSKPIIKSSIVGSAGFINDIFKKLR